MKPKQESSTRYIALDIHKHYAVVAGVDREGEVLLKPRQVTNQQLRSWAESHLGETDRVVIESTTNAWHVYDLLAPLVAEVKVANPIRIKQIAEARTKTDKRDALILARLLAANLIPEVWVPPVPVRELRQLISQRRRLVQMHTTVVNRMHSVSHRHHLGHPKGKRFQEKDMAWREKLSEMERFQLELDLETKQYLQGQIARLTRKLGSMSHQTPWAGMAMCLQQVPGFGIITTMTVLAAIGDISRFETPKHLVSYAGLAPGVEQSGTKKRPKPITKEGRKELRWAMVEVAWRAVRADPVWKRRFQELKRRKHANDAITVIAHQLLIVVWHLLTQLQPYRHYSEERIAFKYLYWSWQLDADQRRQLTKPQFARYYLMRMGIGHKLKRIALDPKHPHRLATEAEVRTLFPERSFPD
jgi:transposase